MLMQKGHHESLSGLTGQGTRGPDVHVDQMGLPNSVTPRRSAPTVRGAPAASYTLLHINKKSGYSYPAVSQKVLYLFLISSVVESHHWVFPWMSGAGHLQEDLRSYRM